MKKLAGILILLIGFVVFIFIVGAAILLFSWSPHGLAGLAGVLVGVSLLYLGWKLIKAEKPKENLNPDSVVLQQPKIDTPKEDPSFDAEWQEFVNKQKQKEDES